MKGSLDKILYYSFFPQALFRIALDFILSEGTPVLTDCKISAKIGISECIIVVELHRHLLVCDAHEKKKEKEIAFLMEDDAKPKPLCKYILLVLVIIKKVLQ